MGKLYRLLAATAIFGCSTPVAAQEAPWRPQLHEPRLWSSAWNDAPPLPASVGIRLSHPPRAAVLGTTFAAGYALGGLLGLRLGETATPPQELGLWLRGWYEGSAVLGLSDRSRLQTGPWLDGASVLAAPGAHTWGDPPVINGIVQGFLRALAITSGR